MIFLRLLVAGGLFCAAAEAIAWVCGVLASDMISPEILPVF
jgi:hypothetical protein